jgi:phage/plasmid-associated DNA primase
LERLHAYFCPRPAEVRLRREFLLYGMGGSGKSQIALKFAEECEQR